MNKYKSQNVEYQGKLKCQNILRKNKTRGLTFSDFETYGTSIVIKTMWYWNKDGNINEWN